MATEVRIDFASFKTAHANIEKDRASLGDVKLSLDGRSSASQALDEFEKRAKETKKLVKKYRSLLENDSLALFEAAQSFEATDEKEAAKYRKSLSKKLGVDA